MNTNQTWTVEIDGEVLDSLVVTRTPEFDASFRNGLKEDRPLAIAALLAQQVLDAHEGHFTALEALRWLVAWRNTYFDSSKGTERVPEMWLRIK